MKHVGMIFAFVCAIGITGLADTGMPAFDNLQADVETNTGICRKLGFSEDQREAILELINGLSAELVDRRDELIAAKENLALAREQGLQQDIREARLDVHLAESDLSAARNEAFRSLQEVVTPNQYKALKKWRTAGKQ